MNKKQDFRQFIFLVSGILAGSLISIYAVMSLSVFSTHQSYEHYLVHVLIVSGLIGALSVRVFMNIFKNYSPGKAIIRIFIFLIVLQLINIVFQFFFIDSINLNIGIFFLPATILILTISVRILSEILKSRFHGISFFNIRNGLFTGIIISMIALFPFTYNENIDNTLVIISFILSLLLILSAYYLNRSGKELSTGYINMLEASANTSWKKIINSKYYRILFFQSLLSKKLFVGVLVSAIIIIQQNYEWSGPVIHHLIIIIVVSFFIGTVVGRFFGENIIKKAGKKLLLLISPFSIILFVGVILALDIFGEVEVYKDLVVPPISLTVIYLSLLVLLIVQLSFENNVFNSYYDVIDLKLRLFTSIRINWESAPVAIILSIIYVIIFDNFGRIGLGISLIFFSIIWIFTSFRGQKIYHQLLEDLLAKKSDSEKDIYCYEIINEIETTKDESTKLNRNFRLFESLHPVMFRKKIVDFCNSENKSLQSLALSAVLNHSVLEAIPVLEKFEASRFYQVSPNSLQVSNTKNELTKIQLRCNDPVYIEQLSYSTINYERKTGALLSEQLKNKSRVSILMRLLYDENSEVSKAAIIASAGCTDETLMKLIVRKLSFPVYAQAAFSCIISTGIAYLDILEKNFNKTGLDFESKVLILRAYSEIGTHKAQEYLLKKIESVDRKIVEHAFIAMNKINAEIPFDKRFIIEEEIEQECQKISSLLVAQKTLENSETYFAKTTLNAINERVFQIEQQIYMYLGVLFNAMAIKQVVIDRYSNNFERVNFSMQLLDSTIPDNFVLKPLLSILLSDIERELKIERLKIFLPIENLTETELYELFLIEAAGNAGAWMKICALHSIENSEDIPVSTDYLIANLSNKLNPVTKCSLQVLIKFRLEEVSALVKRFNLKNGVLTEKPFYSIIDFLQRKSLIFDELPGSKLVNLAEISNIKSINEIDVNLDDLNTYYYVLPVDGDITVNIDNTITKNIKPGELFTLNDIPTFLRKKYRIKSKNGNVKVLVFDKNKFEYRLANMPGIRKKYALLN